MDYVSDHAGDYGITFTFYEVVTLFEEGWLPCDLAAHVYLGIKNKTTGDIVYVFDPWRCGDAVPIDPENNPNGEPDDP